MNGEPVITRDLCVKMALIPKQYFFFCKTSQTAESLQTVNVDLLFFFYFLTQSSRETVEYVKPYIIFQIFCMLLDM